MEGRAAFIEAAQAYHDGQYDTCISGFQKTISLRHEVPFSKMMIARCYALNGDVEKGIEALDEAAEFEFPGAQFVQTNDEFAKLREHARFAEIVAKIQANMRPCPVRARRKQFDFWIGEWDVFHPAGQRAGSSRIESLENGCLIRENWTAPNESTRCQAVTVVSPWSAARRSRSAARIAPLYGEKPPRVHYLLDVISGVCGDMLTL